MPVPTAAATEPAGPKALPSAGSICAVTASAADVMSEPGAAPTVSGVHVGLVQGLVVAVSGSLGGSGGTGGRGGGFGGDGGGCGGFGGDGGARVVQQHDLEFKFIEIEVQFLHPP